MHVGTVVILYIVVVVVLYIVAVVVVLHIVVIVVVGSGVAYAHVHYDTGGGRSHPYGGEVVSRRSKLSICADSARTPQAVCSQPNI